MNNNGMELDLTVFFDGNLLVSRDIFFEKALKVIRPVYLNQSTIPTFYIVNVGGGYLDGDRYRINYVEDNAKVTLTSTLRRNKIYKTPSNHVEQYQTFNLKDNAYLEYVADPIIAYENAKFYQHNTFNHTLVYYFIQLNLYLWLFKNWRSLQVSIYAFNK